MFFNKQKNIFMKGSFMEADMIIPCRILFIVMFIYYFSDLVMVVSRKVFYRVRMSEIKDRQDAYNESGLFLSYQDIMDLYYPLISLFDIAKCLLMSWIFVYIGRMVNMFANYSYVVVLQVLTSVYNTILNISEKSAIATKEEDVKYHRVWLLLKLAINVLFCVVGFKSTLQK